MFLEALALESIVYKRTVMSQPFRIPVFNRRSRQYGGIAVSYYEWSGARQQAKKVEWFNIVDAASSNEFAALIKATKRSFKGGKTAPGNAISRVTPKFGTETGGRDNGFESPRQIIDISGDSRQNDGKNTAKARDAALAKGLMRLMVRQFLVKKA